MAKLGSIHYAKFQDSPRLQRLLWFMIHGEPRTGREIILGADINAVNSAACELRENGFDLRCIKKLNPPTYQLHNVPGALRLAADLLADKKSAA
jgi:hypothetical protein